MGKGHYKHGAEEHRYSFVTRDKRVITVCEKLKKDRLLSKTIGTFLRGLDI